MRSSMSHGLEKRCIGCQRVVFDQDPCPNYMSWYICHEESAKECINVTNILFGLIWRNIPHTWPRNTTKIYNCTDLSWCPFVGWILGHSTTCHNCHHRSRWENKPALEFPGIRVSRSFHSNPETGSCTPDHCPWTFWDQEPLVDFSLISESNIKILAIVCECINGKQKLTLDRDDLFGEGEDMVEERREAVGIMDLVSGRTLTSVAVSNLLLSIWPTSLNVGVPLQHVLNSHDPDTPWHLPDSGNHQSNNQENRD